MTATATQPTTADLFSVADRLRALRERRADLKAMLTDVNADIDTVEQELSGMMVNSECGSFTRDGKMFVLTTKSYWSAAEGCTEALYTALRENGHEHLFSVNPNLLRSFLGETISATADDAGEITVPGWLAGLIRSYDKSGVSIRTAPKK